MPCFNELPDDEQQALLSKPSYQLSPMGVEIIKTLQSYGYTFFEVAQGREVTYYVQGYTGIRLNLSTGRVDGYQGKNQKTQYKIAFAIMGIFACASGFAGTVSKGILIALASAISTYFLNLDGCVKAIDAWKKPSYLLASTAVFSAAITAAQAYQGSTDFLKQETDQSAIIYFIAILAGVFNLAVSSLFNIDALGVGIKSAYIDYKKDYETRSAAARSALTLLIGNPTFCMPLGITSLGLLGTVCTTTVRAEPAFNLVARWWPNYETDYLETIRLFVILTLCTLASGVGLAMFQAAVWRLYLLIMLICHTLAELTKGTFFNREITSANSIIFGTITTMLTSGILVISAWASYENYSGLAFQTISGLNRYFVNEQQIDEDLSVTFNIVVDIIGAYAAANMASRFISIRKTIMTIIAKMRCGFVDKNHEILTSFHEQWKGLTEQDKSHLVQIMQGQATLDSSSANATSSAYNSYDSEA